MAKVFRSTRSFLNENGTKLFGGSAAVAALSAGYWMYSYQQAQPTYINNGGVQVYKGLLTQEDRFLRFAGSMPDTHPQGDVSKGPQEVSMSRDEFILSILTPGNLPPPSREGDAKHLVALTRIFNTLDTDGDGMLSFGEYCALFCFLSTDDEHFRTAFTMFDENENATLDAKEFQLMLRALNPDPSSVPLEIESKNTASLLHYFFGPKLNKSLTFNTFESMVTDLRRAVQEAEFESLDFKGTGELDATDLRRLMFDKLHDVSVDGPVPSPTIKMNEWVAQRNRIRKAHYREGDEHLTATKKTYQKFCEIIRSSDKIQRAMKLYIRGKEQRNAEEVGLTKEEFLRAVHIGIEGKVQLSPREMELFFAIFDGNMNGLIDLAEFNDLCRLNQGFGSGFYRDFTSPPRTTVQQFLNCMMQQQEL